MSSAMSSDEIKSATAHEVNNILYYNKFTGGIENELY